MSECAKCGSCCRWLGIPERDALLDVRLSLTEAAKLINLAEFRKGGSRQQEGWWMKRMDNGDCIALLDNRCHIYEHRPSSCRDFSPVNPRCAHSALS